jgi:hypothetical protein
MAENKKIICINTGCGENLPLARFYKINPKSQIHKQYSEIGVIPVCRGCLRSMCQNSDGTYNIQGIKKALEWLDRPYIDEMVMERIRNGKFDIGILAKDLAINKKYNNMTYADSDKANKQSINKSEPMLDIDDLNETVVFDFKVTKEMKLKWRGNYELEDYYTLESFYNDMALSNNIETAQDIVYLKKLAVISLKMDKALEGGNSSEAKQLGDLFSKYMADSKFRAMDKTDADKTGGIRNFGTIYAEVEKDGFIPPWEHYRKIKGITQDIVDKTIMHIENFTLKLNKVNKMISPPTDTPQLQPNEIDNNSKIEINDIEVDMLDDEIFDELEGEDTNGEC